MPMATKDGQHSSRSCAAWQNESRKPSRTRKRRACHLPCGAGALHPAHIRRCGRRARRGRSQSAAASSARMVPPTRRWFCASQQISRARCVLPFRHRRARGSIARLQLCDGRPYLCNSVQKRPAAARPRPFARLRSSKPCACLCDWWHHARTDAGGACGWRRRCLRHERTHDAGFCELLASVSVSSNVPSVSQPRSVSCSAVTSSVT